MLKKALTLLAAILAVTIGVFFLNYRSTSDDLTAEIAESEPVNVIDSGGQGDFYEGVTKGVMSSASTSMVVTLPDGMKKGESFLIIATAPANISPPDKYPYTTQSQGSVYEAIICRESYGYEKTITLTLDSSVKGSWVAFRLKKGYAFIQSNNIKGKSSGITPSSVRGGNRSSHVHILTTVSTLSKNTPSSSSIGYDVLQYQAGTLDGTSLWIQGKKMSLAANTSEQPSDISITSANYISTSMVIIEPQPGYNLTHHQSVHEYYSSSANRISSSSFLGLRTSSYGIGTSFYGDGSTLTRAGILLRADGSAAGSLVAKIYAHSSGYFGSNSNAYPAGTPLAVSTNEIPGATLSESYAMYEFDFDAFELVAGRQYFITVEISNPNSTSIYFAQGTSLVGNTAYMNSDGVWRDGGGYQGLFYLYSNISEGNGFYFNPPEVLEITTFTGNQIENLSLDKYPFIADARWLPAPVPDVFEIEKTLDPKGSGSTTYRLRTINSDDGERAQFDIEFFPNTEQPIYHSRHRVFFNPDLAYMSQYSGTINSGQWFTIMEFWNDTSPVLSGRNGGSCRWSFGIRKASGAGQKLKFQITADYIQPTELTFSPLWSSGLTEVNDNLDVADYLGQWITFDVWIKRGQGANGRIIISVAKEGEGFVEIINKNDHTIYPDHPELSMHRWQLWKLYAGDKLVDFMTSNSKRIEAWYGPFEIFDEGNVPTSDSVIVKTSVRDTHGLK